MVRPFLAWAVDEGVRRFDDLGVERLRHYRALLASRESAYGRPLQGRSVLDSHKALMTFFRWASDEEYEVDPKILRLTRPKVPEKEATVFNIEEVRKILALAARRLLLRRWAAPAEEVGSGRRSCAAWLLSARTGCRT